MVGWFDTPYNRPNCLVCYSGNAVNAITNSNVGRVLDIAPLGPPKGIGTLVAINVTNPLANMASLVSARVSCGLGFEATRIITS